MAALNLSPDLGLIAVQAGIFLTNMFVVKKFLIEPYLSLRDKRFAETLGSQNFAADAMAEAKEKSAELGAAFASAYDEAKRVRHDAKEKALKEQGELITAAKTEAKERFEVMRKEVEGALNAERAKLPEQVTKLSQDIYQAILS